MLWRRSCIAANAVPDDATGQARQDRGEGCVRCPVHRLPDGGGGDPPKAVPGDPRTDSTAEASLRSVQMMGCSAGIAAEGWEQRRRSVLNRENAPFHAPERLLRSHPKASARVWSTWNSSTWNSLAEKPRPGRIVSIVGGGRQREAIREIPDWSGPVVSAAC